MSPCELEAQGLILSEQNVTTQGDITDVHQRLAGIFIALAVFFFYQLSKYIPEIWHSLLQVAVDNNY